MNGHVLRGTPIAVDCFNVQKCRSVKFFFLTHAHADHMIGLTSTWRSACIYMSEITARIVKHERQVKPEWIRELEVGEAYVIQEEGANGLLGNTESILVSVIDANHCPGSVMYLFQGTFGNVLYTGDFRYCKSMLEVEALRQNPAIHRVYLDNTYGASEWVFPSREAATEEVIRIIIDNFEREIFIGINNLGREDLLVKLAVYFKQEIGVTPQTFERLRLIKYPLIHFSTDLDLCHIKAVPRADLLRMSSAAVRQQQDDRILILPTALFAGVQDVSEKPNFVVVPYSDHSSFSELCEFLERLRPMEILPIVDGCKTLRGENISNRARMSLFDRFLSTYKAPENAGVGKRDACASVGACRSQNARTVLSSNGKSSVLRRRAPRRHSAMPCFKSNGVVFDSSLSSSSSAKEDDAAVSDDSASATFTPHRIQLLNHKLEKLKSGLKDNGDKDCESLCSLVPSQCCAAVASEKLAVEEPVVRSDGSHDQHSSLNSCSALVAAARCSDDPPCDCDGQVDSHSLAVVGVVVVESTAPDGPPRGTQIFDGVSGCSECFRCQLDHEDEDDALKMAAIRAEWEELFRLFYQARAK